MRFKKSIVQIHLWFGFTSGLVVFVLGITGCGYVFMEELKPMIYADRIFVEVPENTPKLPLSKLEEKAQLVLGKNCPINRMEIPAEANQSFLFRSIKKNEEGLTYFSSLDHFKTVYINPYNGKAVYIENTKYEFFKLTLALHRYLFLKESIGKTICGIAVIIFVLMLVTGIILWWPKNKSARKQRFFFRWKDKTKWNRKNFDLHNILGFYACIILMIMALTGLVWVFEWFNNTVQFVGNC